MAGRSIRSAIKQAVCRRDFDPGDVVRVPDGKWDEFEHPIGGRGRWAIFVSRAARDKLTVRPLDGDGVTGKPVVVDEVEHLDDVIREAALRMYYENKGRKRK